MIQLFNDTDKPMTVRINIMGTTPTVTTVKPQMGKMIFTKTDQVLVKVWADGTIMVQDRGEFSIDNLKIRDHPISASLNETGESTKKVEP